MTELNKIRVCDLKIGDVFIIWGRQRVVRKVNGALWWHIVGDDRDDKRNQIAVKSQQWVELVRRSLPEENTYTR
jgi:hypothetical protein